MKEKHINILRCISCGSDALSVSCKVSENNGDIKEGILTCSCCQADFPIIAGIPCLTNKKLWGENIKQVYLSYKSKSKSKEKEPA